MGPTREEFEQAIATSPEAMLVCDADGRIIGANVRICELTGYDRDDLLSKTLLDLADPNETPAPDRLLPVLRENATLDVETAVRCKDGSTTRLHLSLRSLNLGERPYSLVRVARRRRAADRLTQDPEFIRALLNTPGTLVMSVCSEGKISYASPAFQTLTGLDFREIRGRPVWDLLDDEMERGTLREALANAESCRTVKLTWPTATGGPKVTLWTPTFLKVLPPAKPSVLLMGQEVPPPRKAMRRPTGEGASRRELEKRIADLTLQIEELRNEQDAFTYTLAHDLRAPLRAMSGFSDTIIEDYADQPLDQVGMNYALRITESAQRMDALIQDLLVYNRLGQTPVFLAPVVLGPLMSEVLRTYSYAMRGLSAKVEADLPPLEVVADESMLFLILSHFFSNALKFVAPGTAPQVRVRAERSDDRIRIVFEDNGIGISEEYADRIFGVFQRLNKIEAYPGTGMGLAIVRRAAERINARVGVESEVGKGSRFWVEVLAAS